MGRLQQTFDRNTWGKSEYKCKVSDCGKVISTLTGFTIHMLMHDKEKKKWVCETCKKRFPYESFLKRHVPIHSDAKDHKCPSCNCGKTFKSRQSLKTHLELHSGKEFTYFHPGCPKTFPLLTTRKTI